MNKFILTIPLMLFVNSTFAVDIKPLIESRETIFSFIKSENTIELKRICEKKGLSLPYDCNYGSYMLGNIGARQFIKNTDVTERNIHALFETDGLAQNYYETRKLKNPFYDGFSFIYIDNLAVLSSLYQKEVLLVLLNFYRYSEGEYSEYVEEKLIMIFKRGVSSDVIGELKNKFSDEIEEINDAMKN